MFLAFCNYDHNSPVSRVGVVWCPVSGVIGDCVLCFSAAGARRRSAVRGAEEQVVGHDNSLSASTKVNATINKDNKPARVTNLSSAGFLCTYLQFRSLSIAETFLNAYISHSGHGVAPPLFHMSTTSWTRFSLLHSGGAVTPLDHQCKWAPHPLPITFPSSPALTQAVARTHARTVCALDRHGSLFRGTVSSTGSFRTKEFVCLCVFGRERQRERAYIIAALGNTGELRRPSPDNKAGNRAITAIMWTNDVTRMLYVALYLKVSRTFNPPLL